MAKRRKALTSVTGGEVWDVLSDDQRRLFFTLIVLVQVLFNERIHGRKLPATLRKSLRRLDRKYLYPVIAESLYLLIDVPIMEQLDRGRREVAGKKKKRISAARKRPSAVTKKRRAKKKPAPKRHKRKGPAK